MHRQLSPIARAVIDSDHVRVRFIADAILKNSPQTPAYRAIRMIVDAVDENHFEKALPALKETIAYPPDDPELYFLFLGLCSKASLLAGRISDAQRFLHLMKEILEEIRHPEFQAYLLGLEGLHCLVFANFRGAREYLEEALSLNIPHGTGLWIHLKLNCANTACNAMDIITAEKIIAEMLPSIFHFRQFAESFQHTQLRLYRDLGKADEMLAILENLPPDSHVRKEYRLYLFFDTGRWDEYARELADIEKYHLRYFTPARITLFRAMEALGHGNPEKAAVLSREAISLSKTSTRIHLFLINAIQLLASAELSLRNAKSARVLLHMIDPNLSHLDIAPHWMRLFLLEGNEPQAAVALKRILDIPRGGTWILAREMREAHEVSAHQLAKLQLLVSQPAPPPTPPAAAPPVPETIPTRDLLGEDAEIRSVKTLVRKFAPLDTTVLVTGETGTGKEIVTKLLHEMSPRARHPFVPVNCNSIADTLMEAELFGYVKGAFTGAASDHDGLFVTAGKGTLLLDDVESMPARLQAALLRVLESGEVRPVGGTRTLKTTARIVAATNFALPEMIRKGTFREDLYYRLARFEIQLPALRDRKGDIPLLAKHFLQKIYASHPDGPPEMSDELIRALEGYRWPGNVRELENEIQRIAILAGDERLLGSEYFQPGTMSTPAPVQKPSGLRASTHRRREKLLALFHEHPRLRFFEIVESLGCSPQTVAVDLQQLESAGRIRGVRRDKGIRPLYYVKKQA